MCSLTAAPVGGNASVFRSPGGHEGGPRMERRALRALGNPSLESSCESGTRGVWNQTCLHL